MAENDFRNVPPALARLEGRELPVVNTLTLANGVKVVALDGTSQPVNMVSLLRCGGSADVDSKAALQLMLATMGEGSATRSGAEMAYALDSNGSWLKTGVYGHHSVVSMFSLNSRIRDVMPVMVDMLEDASFPEPELEMKKMQMAQRLSVKMQKVDYQADACLRRLVCGAGHPLASQITPQMLLSTRREDVERIYQRTRQPEHTYLYLAGSLTDEVMSTVCSAVESFSPSEVEPIAPRVLPLHPSEPKMERVEVDGALQSKLCMAIPVIGRHHPDYPALHVVTMALGGYFGSRLMMNLREERGLTYGVNASLLGLHEGAWMQVALECSHEYVQEAVDQTRYELRRLVTDPPHGEELERMRRSALVGHLETLDSPIDVVSYYRNILLSDVPPDYFELKQRAILSITPDDVARIASRYLDPEALRIAVGGC